MKSRLQAKYTKEIVPALMKQFGYNNPLQVPRLEKIVINMGVGIAVQDPKHLERAVEELKLIAGQQPVVTAARKAEAGFKIRQGMKIGCKVTLRRTQMYHFLDKLVNVAMPRIKDFRGVSFKSFDGQGNYALGLKEQIIFPEVNPDQVARVQGMDIIFNVQCKNKEESEALLTLLGMPFRHRK